MGVKVAHALEESVEEDAVPGSVQRMDAFRFVARNRILPSDTGEECG